MSSAVLKLLVGLAILLVAFLGAGWERRIVRQPVNIDPVAWYRRARGAFFLSSILLAALAFITFARSGPLTLGRIFPLVFLSFPYGMTLFQFFRARKKFRELPFLVRQKSQRATPVFFWQAVFILLPVILMAAFGFWAILHQRRMVGQDAQARAADTLRGLPDDFGQSVAGGLIRFDAYKGGWMYYLENGVARWPADKLRHELIDNPNEINIISNILAVLRAAFPDWTTGVPPIATFILNTNGEPAWQRPRPPRPPAWLTAMSAGQQAAWTALESADFAGEPTANLVEQASEFTEEAPPLDGKICAEFITLRAQLRNAPATNAVGQLLDFASRHDEVVTESGLTLRSLALAEALRRSKECGPTEKVWNALRAEVLEGGFLAPRLLDEAARSVAGNAELSESVNAMKTCLAERQLRQELAESLDLTGHITETTTTNLWIKAMRQQWFCFIHPAVLGGAVTIVSNQPTGTTYAQPEAGCYALPVVIQAFTNALGQAKVSLPDYFAIACELEGKPLLLPAPWNKPAASTATAEVLSEAHFYLPSPALLRTPLNGPPKDTMFESLPGHSVFTVQVLLADRHLLYARQRQLQWIFGAMIALSVLTALVGFIAARRAFRHQLELNEQKSNFVSSVSHELRAPIASVRLMAENLERGLISGPVKQGEYFRFIVQECRRLSSLIENVLDMSRIEQGRKQYEFEPTNVIALAETTVRLMEPHAAEKGVRLEFHSALRAPNSELALDGRAVQQALVNLIDNAVKHSPNGQTVTVGIDSRAGGMLVLLYVADHGPGIPKAEQEKIFERFYRLGSELRRETQGVGIGLSVVKHIVEAHGGQVIVESEVGRGSRFTIELPTQPPK